MTKIKYDDYPIEECAAVAGDLVAKGHMINQKWTCGHCGSRQTMAEAKKFFRSGRCEECSGITVIQKCNYLLVMAMAGGRR